MKLGSPWHRRVLLTLAAAIGAVAALLSLWPSEPPPLQPLPILGFDWTEAPVNDRALEHQAVRLCIGLAEQPAGHPRRAAAALRPLPARVGRRP